MSSPTSRRTSRNSASATPRRSNRPSLAPQSSPTAQLASEASQASDRQSITGGSIDGTPRQSQSQQRSGTTSSPLFFNSSPALRSSQRSGVRSSSPLKSQVDDDGGATPRANQNIRDSSPIHYASSSPGLVRSSQPRDNIHSSSSALFVRTSGTPARNRRHDINSDVFGSAGARRRRIFVDENGMVVGGSDAATFSNLDPNTSDADALAGGSTSVIWGTNISVADSMHAFKDFLLNFEKKYRMVRDGEIPDTQDLPSDHPGRTREYVDMMDMMLELGVTAFNLDARNLKAYPPTTKLWHQLQAFPNEIIPIMDQGLKDTLVELAQKKMNEMRSQAQRGQHTQSSRPRDSSSLPPHPSSDAEMTNGHATGAEEIGDLVQDVEINVYRVRPFALDKCVNLRDLNPADMDKLVSVKGLVIRTTPIIPDMKDAFFRCTVCNHTVRVDIDRGKIAEPSRCPRQACDAPNAMQIVHNRSGFADKQVIKLQETPDSVPDGQTPHSVSVCVYDELVDVCKAGDRVEITGIFKSSQVRVNPRQRSVKNIFKTYVDGLHIQKTDKKRMGIDPSTVEEELAEQATGDMDETRKISDEEEARIKEIAARPDVYELLSRSLAPSIYEMEDVKKGILLQLFGGTNKSFEKGGSPKYRGDINVLLCGDPSTSKSQLLKYVHKIAPRGVYTSGKGSSAVGLTAYVTRDPETRQLVLESGALVLSDGGVCCIDEFDKMSDATRSVLHEVMEQQTVSIAKAGIITTLNARTSILASANPIGSKYNPSLPVPANIDLPPTLLSRFDLVYLVLDHVDEMQDRRLARHMVGMYLEDAPENASSKEVLPIEFLTAYISYARQHCQPRISEPAARRLSDAYVAMRALGSDVRSADRRITATTRQLESMIRLSEAHAKMRLADTVEESDVDEAVRLIKSALKQAATDARTGLIDMGLLTEGMGAGDRRRREDLKHAVSAVVDEMGAAGAAVRVGDLVRRLVERAQAGGGGEVENNEVMDALRALEAEGKVKISGEGPRRVIRRVAGAV